LRASENQAEFGDIHGSRSNVRRHIGNQGRGAGWQRVILRAFDGVVGAQVGVGSIGGQLDFLGARDASELLRFGAGGDVVEKTLLQFADGFRRPGAGVQHIDGLAGQSEILRHGGKLQAASALDEDHRVVFGNRKELAKVSLGGVIDGLVLVRAVRHFHDGHAGAAVVEQLFANTLENRKRQSRRTGVEIKSAMYRARRGRRAHGEKPFAEDLRCVRKRRAKERTAFQNSRNVPIRDFHNGRGWIKLPSLEDLQQKLREDGTSMRLRSSIVLVPVIAIMGCARQAAVSRSARPMSAAERTAVDESVRGFMAQVAQEVTQGGPTTWSKEFEDGPNFFMASEGVLVFPSGAAAAQGIAALTQIIKKIELQWGQELRVDPLSPELAAVGSTYQEIRTDLQGHELTEKGYFTGVVEQRNGKWQFRNAHWSVETPPGK